MKQMFKKLTALSLTLLLLLSMATVVTVADDTVVPFEGSGTQNEPFLIKTADDLLKLQELSNSSDAQTKKKYAGDYNNADPILTYYKLTADIDMSGKTFVGIGRSDLSTVSNMGGYGSGFIGQFDGNGHVIKNLVITGTQGKEVGLFGHTMKSTFKNLGLENVVINGNNSGATGALIGKNRISGTTVENCYAKNVTLKNCGTSAGVGAGGLIGQASEGKDTSVGVTLSNCYTRNITTENTPALGGLVGQDAYGFVAYNASNCYSDVDPLFKGTKTNPSTAANVFIEGIDAFTATDLGEGFAADFEDESEMINDGLPVLKWQISRFVKPGFTADSTTVIQAAADANGYPSFIVYGWLNNFNTSAEGMEYGMKISNGNDWEEYLPARVKVVDGDNITYVPAAPLANGQFAIRVYVKGLESDATYTMTPYIGKAGNYTYGDVSDEYTVTVD